MTTRAAERFREMCVTVLGSGYAPFASGTFGSAAAAAIYLACWFAADFVGLHTPLFDLVVVAPGMLLATVGGILLGPWAIARYGRKDPKPFVLDEFAGQWAALILMPPCATATTTGLLAVVASQFFLFRALDVIKPPPANWIDRDWPAGWGITLDDVVAGIYANFIGQILWRATPLATCL